MSSRGLLFGRLGGIPIYVDLTWFFFAPIVAIALAKLLGDPALGLVGVVLIYLCNLGHECCHAALAKRYGAVVQDIILFALGTVVRTEDVADPRQSRAIALAGPIYSLILGLALLGLGLLAVVEFKTAAFPIVRLVFAVASVTLAFGFFFNLLPIWPMDGGRILRASLRLVGHSKARSASFCLGITLALCGAAILWGSLDFAMAGSFAWWPKIALATMLILNALATYKAELSEQH